MYSPWGRSQRDSHVAGGIVDISTSSHGGIWLADYRIALLPPKTRAYVPFAGRGFYEDVLDWSIPYLAYSSLFKAYHARQVSELCKLTPIDMGVPGWNAYEWKGMFLSASAWLDAVKFHSEAFVDNLTRAIRFVRRGHPHLADELLKGHYA